MVVIVYFSLHKKQEKIVFSQASHSDWRTYVNKSAGYLIQYPSDVFFTESDAKPRDGAPIPGDGYTAVSLYFGEYYGNSGNYITISTQKNVQGAEDVFCSRKKIIAIAIIDSREWAKRNCEIGYFASIPDITEHYNLNTPEFAYKIVFNYGKEFSDDKRIFMESILSTFKFVEKNQIIKETNTYKSENLGISFEYPFDWRIMEGVNQVNADITAPNGLMRFDVYRFDAATRTDFKDTDGCKIVESTEGATLACSNSGLSEYIVRYGSNGYVLKFEKESGKEIDPQYKDKYDQLNAEMFAKNVNSFQKILASIRFIK